MVDVNIHPGTDHLRRKMMDLDVVAALLARLHDQIWTLPQSVLDFVMKLAEHGKFSDQ